MVSGQEKMKKRLTIIPEKCSGCRLCELACSFAKFKVNNPKKAAIRVISLYPHPVIKMPIFCRQCKEPKCMENCPTDAMSMKEGVVVIDGEKCISCANCVISCPFGAIFSHPDIKTPFKCDLCGGSPKCVEVCPTKALIFVPEHLLGQQHRLMSVLRYSRMEEIEYVEGGEKKRLRYADIGNAKKEG
ncbi:MAG: 4Fe-4S dicluster domain-containing protein [Candidatus Methanospirareceae archaeon]